MKKLLSILSLSLTLGIASPGVADSVSEQQFANWMKRVISNMEKVKNYKPLPVKTDQQLEDLMAVMYAAYTDEATPSQIKRTLKKQYPDYDRSIEKFTQILFATE